MSKFLARATVNVISICAVFFVAVIHKPASARKFQNSLELVQLISKFMLPQEASYNVLNWSTGSSPDTPIHWQHDGIRECDQFALGINLKAPFCRTGSVVVTVEGKPTYTVLRRIIEPGSWKVTLGGSRAGVEYIVLDADVLSQELDSRVLIEAVSKAEGGIHLTQIIKCGLSSGGSSVYRVDAAHKKPAVIKEWWSCGSGGCAVTLTLVINWQDAVDLTSCK